MVKHSNNFRYIIHNVLKTNKSIQKDMKLMMEANGK